MELKKGANTHIQNPASVQVQLSWGEYPFAVTPVCLFLSEDEKLLGVLGREDTPFVQDIQLGEQLTQYRMNLDEVPSTVNKIVFGCVLEGRRPAPKVEILVGKENEEKVRFEWSQPWLDRTLLIGEIYRYKTKWKVRAVGEGLRGGKEDLLLFYQEKEKDPVQTTPKMVVVMDASIYAYPFYETGKLQKLFTNIYIASSTLNPLKEMDVWFYAATHKRAQPASKANFQHYIDDLYMKPSYFHGLGLENHEQPLMIELMETYKHKETIIFFITNGNFLESPTFEEWNYDENGRFFWEMIILDEKVEPIAINHVQNRKVLSFQSLDSINQGDIQQRLLTPIKLWRKESGGFEHCPTKQPVKKDE